MVSANESSAVNLNLAPITGLYVDRSEEGRLVLVRVSELVVVKLSTNTVLRTIPLSDKEEEIEGQEGTVFKEHLVLDASFNSTGTKFAVITDSKILRVFETTNWEVIFERALVKRATALAFTHTTDELCIADKFGDAYRFQLDQGASQAEDPIVGHVSVLTDIALTSDDKLVVTSDRDEKVRVSCYPNGYNIHSFCLGHREFVSSVCLPFPVDQARLLISGGGDPYLLVSDYFTGKFLANLPFATLLQLEVVPPRLTVSRILSSPVSEANSWVAVLVEGLPKLLLFQATPTELVFKQLIELPANPISLEFDSAHSFYVSLYSDSTRLIHFKLDDQSQFTSSPADSLLALLPHRSAPPQFQLPLIGDYRKLRPGAPGDERLGMKAKASNGLPNEDDDDEEPDEAEVKKVKV